MSSKLTALAVLAALSVDDYLYVVDDPSGSPISKRISVAAAQYSSTAPGLVPASGGGTANFLRADGSWALPLTDGDRGDITVSASGTAWTIDNDSVTYAKMQNVSANRFLGRITASVGDVEELTGAQATTLLDPFSSSLKGLVPASGGGGVNFLRADGSWAVPPGTPGGSNTQVQFNDSGAFGGDAGLTYNKTTDALSVSGSVTAAGFIVPGRVGISGDHGSIELGDSTAPLGTVVPFIDWHYAVGGSQDYNFRFQNADDGLMRFSSVRGDVIDFVDNGVVANNRFRIQSNSAGNAPHILAVGSDINIDIGVTPKGTGRVSFNLDSGWVAAYPNSTATGLQIATDVDGYAPAIVQMSRWTSSYTGNQEIGRIVWDGIETDGGYTPFASIVATTATNTAIGAKADILIYLHDDADNYSNVMSIDHFGRLMVNAPTNANGGIYLKTVGSHNPALILYDTTDAGWTQFSQGGAFRLATTNASGQWVANMMTVDASGNFVFTLSAKANYFYAINTIPTNQTATAGLDYYGTNNSGRFIVWGPVGTLGQFEVWQGQGGAAANRSFWLDVNGFGNFTSGLYVRGAESSQLRIVNGTGEWRLNTQTNSTGSFYIRDEINNKNPFVIEANSNVEFRLTASSGWKFLGNEYVFSVQNTGGAIPGNEFGWALGYNTQNGGGGVDVIDTWDNASRSTVFNVWKLESAALVKLLTILDSGALGVGVGAAPSASTYVHFLVPTMSGGGDAALFSKVRDATNSVRWTFGDVGGLTGDAGGAFWRGFHFNAPTITDPVGGASLFPRLSVYSEYNSLTAPSTRNWVLEMGNDTSTSKHTFRLRSGIDLLVADSSQVAIGNGLKIYLPSGNNDWGWQFQSVDNGGGDVPLKIFAVNAGTPGEFARLFQSGGINLGGTVDPGDNSFIATGGKISATATGGVHPYVSLANYASLQAALDALPSSGGTIFVPAGQWDQSSATSKAIPASVQLVGEGPGLSVLNWTNNSGGLTLTFDGSPGSYRDEHVTIRGISFTTTAFNGTTGGGTALKLQWNIVQTNGKTDVIVENCQFLPHNGGNSGANYQFWTEGIALVNARQTFVRACNFIGNSDNWLVSALGVGIRTYGWTVQFNVTDCSFTSLSKGIYLAGMSEGFYESKSPFVNCNYGIYMDGTDASVATTSSTNLTIGTGSKSFTVGSGKDYWQGMQLKAFNGGNSMTGLVTSYSGTSLVINVTSTTGSGTFNSWTINPNHTMSDLIISDSHFNFWTAGVYGKDTAFVFIDNCELQQGSSSSTVVYGVQCYTGNLLWFIHDNHFDNMTAAGSSGIIVQSNSGGLSNDQNFNIHDNMFRSTNYGIYIAAGANGATFRVHDNANQGAVTTLFSDQTGQAIAHNNS